MRALICAFLAAVIMSVGVAGNAWSDDKTGEACKIVGRYMDRFYKAYEAGGKNTDPKHIAALRGEIDHKLLSLGVSGEVFVQLARFEFACRSCFFLGIPSECRRMSLLRPDIIELAGCVE